MEKTTLELGSLCIR